MTTLLEAPVRRETLQEFLDRKHDPKWKPKALPRSRNARLSDAKFSALLRQYGGSGIVKVK
jgi:hypothetical protein